MRGQLSPDGHPTIRGTFLDVHHHKSLKKDLVRRGFSVALV
jgi:hypothetical protein